MPDAGIEPPARSARQSPLEISEDSCKSMKRFTFGKNKRIPFPCWSFVFCVDATPFDRFPCWAFVVCIDATPFDRSEISVRFYLSSERNRLRFIGCQAQESNLQGVASVNLRLRSPKIPANRLSASRLVKQKNPVSLL